MSKAITSKYRPKSFSEVVGQDAVVRSLEEALKSRSGTAYLLSGPSGCGKTTLARIAASYLGCAPEDRWEIDAATKTGIEDMRDVMEGLMYRPLGDGDVRAVIVDECFTADTLVDTSEGSVPIADVSEGALVRGASGTFQRVARVVRKQVSADRLCRVVVPGGQTTVCSEDHAFLTTEGWVHAKNLAGKCPAADVPENLLRLWDAVYEFGVQQASLRALFSKNVPRMRSIVQQRLWHLFARLREQSCLTKAYRHAPLLALLEATGDSTSQSFEVPRALETLQRLGFSAYVGVEHAVGVSRTGACDKAPERHAEHALLRTWRERARAVCSTSAPSLAGWWRIGVGGEDRAGSWRGRLALKLQVRHWLSCAEARRRSGRPWTQQPKIAGAGSAEREAVGQFGVAYLTVQEQGDFVRRQGCVRDGVGFVNMYDLTIAGHPSFSVHGVTVHNCHALSKAAVTSLLKALEDPPPWVYWFLCTTDPQKVPAAVKTRCLSYQLKEVGVRALAKLLSKTDEGRTAGPDIVDLCAKEARGSPRQALANLGVCVGAGSLDDARELMRTAAEAPAAIDLARILLNGGNWNAVRPVIEALSETSAESVRHVIRAYMTKVALSSTSRSAVEQALTVLEAFSQPFHAGDGVSPLVLVCGRLVLLNRSGG